jgi:hypothetical protein
MRTLLAVLGLALLLPATAQAGGWATAGVLNPPQGVAPGETWNARIEILQHGRTPLTGVEPAVIVGDQRFPAKPTDKPGVYTAAVKFTQAGNVEYLVDDGFGNAGAAGHSFFAEIGGSAAPAPAAAAGDDFPWMPMLAGAFAALGLAVLVTSRRGTVPA